ncbi:MAG: hypothetical protein JSU63_18450 [Phycisphaerales bacterium]|nr:MAG: hypothetical protein JSU63_18450 [Phycisphaerales bacterium]
MTKSENESTVITGCGWVTPIIAGTIDDVLSAYTDRESISPGDDGFAVVPETLRDAEFNLSPELKRDRGAWMAGVALEYARRGAVLSAESVPPERVGMVLGCALAGQLGMMDFAGEVREQTPRFVSPIHFPQTVGNYLAGALARAYAIRGPNSTIACGAASSLRAIIEAQGILAGGEADLVYAGGVEQFSEELACGLHEPDVCLSEGACWFVLERSDHAGSRGVTPLATLSDIDVTRGGAGADGEDLEGIRSSAGIEEENTIVIEHWIGRCLGGLGAAATAAAIGAVRGHPLPLLARCDPRETVISRCTPTRDATSRDTVAASVTADAGSGRRTAIGLRITTGN